MTLSAGIASVYPRLYRGVTQDLCTARTTTGADQVYELPQDELGTPDRLSIDFISLGTGGTFDIEGSDDASFPAGAIIKLLTGVNAIGKQMVIDKPVRFIRANQTAISGGSSTVRATNAGHS
jgi:hypothetical protein